MTDCFGGRLDGGYLSLFDIESEPTLRRKYGRERRGAREEEDLFERTNICFVNDLGTFEKCLVSNTLNLTN